MVTAHIRNGDKAEQSVYEHSKTTAITAKMYLESVGLGSAAYLAGLLHDTGKLTDRFNSYIHGCSEDVRGDIDHSYTGAKYLLDEICGSDLSFRAAAIMIAHVIISHHSLHDWIDGNDENYLIKRIAKNDDYSEAIQNFKEQFNEDVTYLLKSASEEINNCIRRIAGADKTESAFYAGMLERLIQSALIDADRTDTADFMANRTVGDLSDAGSLWSEMEMRLNEKLSSFAVKEDPISLRRKMISDKCFAFAEHKVGACRLIVPTGGGKTLSSLRFAVRQCEKFGMERIIYIAPFMSILEQNGDIIGSLAGEDNYLEHHSNIIAEIDDENEYNEYQLHAERWDKPVIAATMVQFLNSLFSAKTSSVRRMHRLCNSVVIIDEVQSVPIKCVHLFSLAVNFLTKVCGCSVVLCSATQPTFEKNDHQLCFDEKCDMIPDYREDFKHFKRTEVIDSVTKYGYDLDMAARFGYEKFMENGDLLFVVNTKSEAAELYRRLKGSASDKAEVIHLSTNMCPAHRKDKIEELNSDLKDRRPVICVTTQLIEAGVDISFRCVIRALAGMDNTAQAAGRCNRNGENETLCPVYIINLKDEKLGSLDEIKNAKLTSIQMFQNITGDVLSADVQSEYFEKLYSLYSGKLSYSTGKNEPSLLELLSLNREKLSACRDPKPDRYMSQSFKTAGTLFEVIDNNSLNVIVPYNSEAEEIISRLLSKPDPEEMRKYLRKAQRYTVGIYPGTEKKLRGNNAVSFFGNEISVLDKSFYDPEFGVITEGAERELLIF